MMDQSRVPKNEKLREAWLLAIGYEQWPSSLSKRAIVCSVHFTEECFDRTSACGITRLRENSVPSLHVTPVTYECMEFSPSTSQAECSTPDPIDVPEIEEAVCSPIGLQCTRSTQTSQTFYLDLASRQKLTVELAKMSSSYKSVLKELRTLKRQEKREKRKLANLKNIISHLSKQNFLSSDNLKLLSKFSVTSKELCPRQLKRTGKYSPELRKFAIALHFYSPKAYRFVRSEFNTCLPHPKVISSWYRSVDGQPGFWNIIT